MVEINQRDEWRIDEYTCMSIPVTPGHAPVLYEEPLRVQYKKDREADDGVNTARVDDIQQYIIWNAEAIGNQRTGDYINHSIL